MPLDFGFGGNRCLQLSRVWQCRVRVFVIGCSCFFCSRIRLNGREGYRLLQCFRIRFLDKAIGPVATLHLDKVSVAIGLAFRWMVI